MTNTQTPQETGAFGKYKIERRLGAGGTAEVYLAREEGPAGRQVVLKRPLPELREDPLTQEIFAEEARLHRWIRHPGIVEIFDAGEFQGEPYLAMQFIDGIDAFRLLRRAYAEERCPPEALGVHVGIRLCNALQAIHAARDEQGAPLEVLHRDISPSNVFFSLSGEVFLGDLGAARSAARSSRPHLQSSAIKGKHGYLAPELINGEEASARSDIFSCAVVIAELLLGKPLFVGSGQVATLLAIRDGRIDVLRAAARHFSSGLFEVLERALSLDPAARFPSAQSLATALTPFDAPDGRAQSLLAEWVAWARDPKGLARRLGGALLASEARIRQAEPPLSAPLSAPATVRQPEADELIPVSETWSETEATTTRIDKVPSRIRFASGKVLNTVQFARIIEMIVTGELGPNDEVDWMGQGFRPVEQIELLERHLPSALSTRNVQVPAPPDLAIDLTSGQLLPMLGQLACQRATGLIVIEGSPSETGDLLRLEVYLLAGHLHHVASSDSSDLLGQSLIRQGIISSSELDLALAVLPRFQGRLGDTLIALGLVDPVVLFRSIEGQGRGRFLRLFSWVRGSASFFQKVQPTRVGFPLDVDLIELLLQGMAIAYPNDTPIIRSRAMLGRTLRALTTEIDVVLPPTVARLIRAVGTHGLELRRVLGRLASSGEIQPADALRAMYVAIALGFCEIA